MLSEVSDLFNLGINRKMLIMLKSFLYIQFHFSDQKNGIEYKKDLALKLWGMIENMLSEVSDLINLGINRKILIMLKSVIAYVILRFGPGFKTVLSLILVSLNFLKLFRQI